jgi:plastocyanin
MIKKLILSSMVSLAALATTQAAADQQKIHKLVLKDGGVSHMQLDVKVGDKIIIEHNDDTPAVHRLFTTGDNYNFDLSNMGQGDYYQFTAKTPGTFDITCHSMKDMVIAVNVTQ